MAAERAQCCALADTLHTAAHGRALALFCPAAAAAFGVSGEYKRKESKFRNWITADGEFPAEAGRYHLYGQRTQRQHAERTPIPRGTNLPGRAVECRGKVA